MNLAALFTGVLMYAIIKTMIIANILGGGSLVLDVPEIPEYGLDGFETRPFATGGIGIVTATQNIAIAIFNIVVSIITIIAFLAKMLIYLGALFIFVIINGLAPIPGAPGLVNVLFLTPIAMLVGVIMFKSFRKGDTSA